MKFVTNDSILFYHFCYHRRRRNDSTLRTVENILSDDVTGTVRNNCKKRYISMHSQGLGT